MEIWLKQDKKALQLPVNPEGFEAAYSRANTSINVTNFGEVNIIGKRNLQTISLSSFFPKKQYGFCQCKIKYTPKETVKLIKSWSSNPVRLTMTGTGINMLTTIESFTYAEQDGTRDVYFTLELKEYRQPEVKVKKKGKKSGNKKSSTTTTKTKRPTKTVKKVTHVVKKGDTLWAISVKYTGSGNNWQKIAKANGVTNCRALQIGKKLVIDV